MGDSLRAASGPSGLLSIGIFALLGCLSLAAPGFLSWQTILTITQQTAIIAICTLPMTALIIARGIDLSVGANLALGGIASGLVLQQGGGALTAIPVALLVTTAMGAVNGMLVGFAGVAPFMATLATMAAMRGMTLLLSGANSIPVDDSAMLWSGSTSIAGIPTPVVLAALAAACWIALMQRTVFGRWVLAIGGNEAAARATLIPVRAVHLTLYALSGLSAGIGAVITVGRLGSAQPLAGTGLEFAAITAAMVGGTSLAGGRGAMLPSLLGALLLGIVAAGLAFLQVPLEITYVVTAALLLGSSLLTNDEWVKLPRLRPRPGRTEGTSPSPRSGLSRELHAKGLHKSYGALRALKDGTFLVRSGTVLGLVGENGAGKSTLVRCLTGIQSADGGTLTLDGAALHIGSPADARAAGITAIHQHFSLLPDLSIAENLALLAPPTRFGLVRQERMVQTAREALEAVGLDMDPRTKLGTLAVGQRQQVEIAKALMSGAWLIIMDEPTSALSVRERDTLFGLISRLKERGCAVIYISHKLDEIFTLCDEVTVLRDGATVGGGAIGDYTPGTLVRAMVGRTLDNVFPHEANARGEIVLRVTEVSDGGRLKRASLDVHAGETVGICGLMGSGRTELLRCIAGLDRALAGTVTVSGRPLPPGDPAAAFAAGVAYLPEDRHAEGFFGQMSVADNLALATMRSPARWVAPGWIGRMATALIDSLGIRPPRPEVRVKDLSGGNQQKVVLGKWLACSPSVLLLDEPTNGVDVGAKTEIHKLVSDCRKRGAAVLMVSSELPELLGVADRLVVMSKGRVVGQLPRGASEDEVMRLAFGLEVGFAGNT